MVLIRSALLVNFAGLGFGPFSYVCKQLIQEAQFDVSRIERYRAASLRSPIFVSFNPSLVMLPVRVSDSFVAGLSNLFVDASKIRTRSENAERRGVEKLLGKAAAERLPEWSGIDHDDCHVCGCFYAP